jgi:hypothetical protein
MNRVTGMVAVALSRSGISTPLQSVAGFVIDEAYRPIPGVRVESVAGPQAGDELVSDAQGLFKVAVDDGFPLRAAKPGYISAIETVRTTKLGGRPWVLFVLEVAEH